MTKIAKNAICLWNDGDAEDAARFYAETFPDSSVGAVHRAPGDFPLRKEGDDVLTVEFTVKGIPCIGLNVGPAIKHNWAFSIQVATVDQADLLAPNSAEIPMADTSFRKCNWGIKNIFSFPPHSSAEPSSTASTRQ